MQIKVIADGSTKWDRFIRRWGVSFLIDKDILFDTFGDPEVFLSNIDRYDINLSNIKHIVISHDHWDHISGLWYLLNRYKNVSVYICPNFKPEIKERIKSFNVNVVEVNGLRSIKDGIYSTGQMNCELEGKNIFEQSLVLKSNCGLIVVTGCAHPGIVTIIDNIKKQFSENIYLIIGGLHLKDTTEKQIREVISRLKVYGVHKIVPMHCTGKLAIDLIKKTYEDNFIHTKEGSEIVV